MKDDIEIKNLAGMDADTAVEAFEAAFADYSVAFDRRQILAMLERRGFNAQLSFGAFSGGRLVAFTYNGVGMYRGVLTSYDCATGTLPGFRGQGLAGAVFRHGLPFLRAAGVRKCVLEVLKENAPARAVYEGLGFVVDCEYDCYRQAKEAVSAPRAACAEVEIRAMDAGMLCGLRDWCDFEPSWQNSVESIERGVAGLTVLGAYIGDVCVGYCVADIADGDLTQIAVAPSHRRRGVGSALLASVLPKMTSPSVKMLNVEHGCTPLRAFLDAAGMVQCAGQYGMSRDIAG